MYNYIDMHCDTLFEAFTKRKDDISEFPEGMIDIKRLKEAKAKAQFFAIYMFSDEDKEECGSIFPSDDEYIDALCKIFRNTLDKNKAGIAYAGNKKDLEENEKAGKISAFLTIEDGRSVDGKLEKIKKYHDAGVRLITLTWNFANCFGFPNSKNPEIMNKGLTEFGAEAVEYMNDTGVIVDVSHLSDGGFYDVAKISKVPFVASHSNCRSLCSHQRNLTDEMIKILADKGGVSGINFGPEFLNSESNGHSRIEDMVAHIKHFIKVGGEDCVAIGSDFDGVSGTFDIGSPDKMHCLFEALHKEGFSETRIEKLAFGNVKRVIGDILG